MPENSQSIFFITGLIILIDVNVKITKIIKRRERELLRLENSINATACNALS